MQSEAQVWIEEAKKALNHAKGTGDGIVAITLAQIATATAVDRLADTMDKWYQLAKKLNPEVDDGPASDQAGDR